MSLNLSREVGPSGRPVLGLKAFKRPPEKESTPVLEAAPADASSALAPKTTPPSAWQWLRRNVPIIRKCRPAVIGSGDVIRERAMACGLSEPDVHEALRLWFKSDSYLKALAAEGSMRHDFDGNPIEPVSDDHRQYALGVLNWRAKRKAAAAAEQGASNG